MAYGRPALGYIVCINLLGALTIMIWMKDKLLLVLFVLLGITLFSWGLNFSIALDEKSFGVALLVLAFLKVRLIVVHYMESSKAILPLRIAVESWVFGTGLATIILYLQ